MQRKKLRKRPGGGGGGWRFLPFLVMWIPQFLRTVPNKRDGTGSVFDETMVAVAMMRMHTAM